MYVDIFLCQLLKRNQQNEVLPLRCGKGGTICYPGGGGGMEFFLETSYFFSLFAQKVIFFKRKLQQVFSLQKITH